jgi:Tfp pilus assembly protein PilP
MNKYVLHLFITLFLLILLPAQENQTQSVPKTSVEEEEFQMEEPQSNDFFYNPMGRRDPFWDLSKGRRTNKGERKEGVSGLAIDELSLVGIFLMDGNYKAIFKGPNQKKPYLLGVGTMVYDGEIINIETNKVIFRKILTVAMGGTREKIITKTLKPDEEVGKKNEY